MQYAFQQSFQKGTEKAVIMGSDCPEITPNHIRKAFNCLQTDDIVIGPSKDGGYYLLGMNAFHPELFENIKWSTNSVYWETIAKIQEKGLTYKKLPRLNDIDTREDLLKSGKIL
jgi:rSAM/selenodomain-associated transferase 1